MCLPDRMAVSAKRDRQYLQLPLPIAQYGKDPGPDTGRIADDDDETDTDESTVKPTIGDSSTCCSSTSGAYLTSIRDMQKEAAIVLNQSPKPRPRDDSCRFGYFLGPRYFNRFFLSLNGSPAAVALLNLHL